MSPFKQSFLGTLLAALVVGAILIAGAVMAQEYYPVRDVNGDGRINTLDIPVSYTHLRAHETVLDLVCRLLLETKKHSTIAIVNYRVYRL